MSVSPYLLHVNSSPTKVTDDLWSEWYTTEHLPDLVDSKTSTRATFYKEIASPFEAAPNHERKFLALYQTDYEECLKTKNYTDLRTTSELFPKEGGTKNIGDNGNFNARNYELIQEYDPKSIGNVPPPQILTVEIQPQDHADFDKWYREEHLPLLAKIRGYRRSLRYKFGPRTPLTMDAKPPMFLAVHEVEDVSAFASEEAKEAGSTEWGRKYIGPGKGVVVRGWALVHAEGF